MIMLKKVLLIPLLLLFTGIVLFAQIKTLPVEDQRKFDYYFHSAVLSKSQGNYSDAFDQLTYCMEIDSTNANVNYEMGNFLSLLNEKGKAFDYYKRAADYDGGNFYYRMAHASTSLELKQYSDAIEQFEGMVKQFPDNKELYVYLSESYRLFGDYAKAIDALDKFEKINGLNEKLSLQKFQLYTALKQESKAFAEIQKYIEKYPTEIKYRILLGDLYMQAGKNHEAFMTYSKAKAIDPDDPYLITSIAEYYEKTGNKTAAEDELQIALVSPKMDIDTKLAILAQYIGTLHQNNQDTKNTNALFDTLTIQHPQEPKLNMMYGNLLMLQKNKEGAREQFQMYVDANPSDPTGWEQMLSTAFPDSISLSIKICEDAISNISDQPQFYFYLGLSEYLDKRYEKALSALQKGLKYVDPNNASLLSDFYGQIGDLYHQTNKQDSSYAAYEKSLKLNPNNLGILNNYSYYLSLQKKDLDKAEAMSSKTIKAEPTNPTYLDTYGWILFEQGAYLMAKIYIENAVNYSKEAGDISHEVLDHYGDVLYKTDEKEKALEYWIKAKEVLLKEEKADPDKIKRLEKKIETKTYTEPE